MCMVSFNNGSSMIILTKTVSNCMKSVIDTPVCAATSLHAEPTMYADELPGMLMMNQSKPKTLQFTKVIPCTYSVPASIMYDGEI